MISKVLFASSALLAGNNCGEINVTRQKKISLEEINEVETYNFEYGEYTTTIYIGSPPQAIDNVVLDTGSYMPWVKISGWGTDASCPGITPLFNPKKSTTFSSISGRSSSSVYGTGNMDGLYAYDNFCFNNKQAGTCFDQYLLSFIGANETSSALGDFQGVIGLGPHQVGAINLFENQVGKNGIDTVFSVYYCLDERVQSKIIFGPSEVSTYALAGSTDADVQWANIAITDYDQNLQWISQLSSASLGSGQLYNT